MNEDGKILGMPRKTAFLVIGGAALVVVLVFLSRRGQGQAQPILPPPTEPMGGGRGPVVQIPGGAETGAAQANLALENMRAEQAYRRQLETLDLEGKRSQLAFYQAGERASQEYQQARAGLNLEAVKRREEFEAGLQGDRLATERAALQREASYLRADQAAGERLAKAAQKAPVKCPPGMHPANVPGEGLTCRALGNPDGSRGFQPFRQVGNILGGLLFGVGQAAPGIGYGAAYAGAQYGLAQAGILNQPYGTSPVQRISSRRETYTGGQPEATPVSGAAGMGPSYVSDPELGNLSYVYSNVGR